MMRLWLMRSSEFIDIHVRNEGQSLQALLLFKDLVQAPTIHG